MATAVATRVMADADGAPHPTPAGNLSCADPRSPLELQQREQQQHKHVRIHLHHRPHLRQQPHLTNSPASPSSPLARPPLRSDATPPPSSPAAISSPSIDITNPPAPPALPYCNDPSVDRNQAPGILDRRKTLPLGRRKSVSKSAKRPPLVRAATSTSSKGRLASIPKKHRLSKAEFRSELRAKDDDNMDDTSGAENFEDAPEQDPTRPSTSNSNHKPNGTPAASASEKADSENQKPISTEPKLDEDAPYNASAEASRVNSPEHSRHTTLDSPPEPPKSISRDRSISPTKRLPINTRDRSISPTKIPQGQRSPVRVVQGLSGDLPGPGMFPPPPSSSERAQNLERTQSSSPTPAAPGFARKASAGLSGFLGRMGTMRKQARSPSVPGNDHERRNTQTSMTSVDSSMADDRRFSGLKPSLQEQFKSLRSQQEDSDDSVFFEGDVEATPKANRHSNASLALASPSGSTSSGERPLKSPPLNPSLPPGTAQGVSAGPPHENKVVDWNLWQSLVSEGPAALARSSGEELSKAIAAGIPQAIRGVVWQVLAESKNEELEIVYRTLRARGSSDADGRPPPPTRSGSASTPNGTIDEEADTSPTSSTQDASSNSSTPPAVTPSAASDANVNGVAGEVKTKLLAEKQKRESATIAKLEKVIKRDMGARTSYSKYVQAAGLQDSLFGVCKAYALFDEGVGYAQGINFITMPLLFYMAEEEAFTLLVRLMSKYDVRSLFTADMPGLHKRLYQFERLLEDHEPALACHLKRRNVGPQLYATQWFLTLFTYRFPLQLTTRVYDLVFAEGLTAIFKFALALMKHSRQTLLDMKDMGQLSTFLKEKLFDFYIDKSPSSSALLDTSFFGAVTGGVDKEIYRADEMVRDACEIKIAEADLTRYANEWEEQNRLERERAEELEKLRSASITLTARVRQLEEETQQKDTEHVTIAGDLVRVKVENERLSDENEGLKMRVEELQRLVDKQPAEIEANLREEMERIMQRNIEVQNENRALKEEMDEFETELVRVKVAHAETLSDHEALKQKWSGMQAFMKDSR